MGKSERIKATADEESGHDSAGKVKVVPEGHQAGTRSHQQFFLPPLDPLRNSDTPVHSEWSCCLSYMVRTRPGESTGAQGHGQLDVNVDILERCANMEFLPIKGSAGPACRRHCCPCPGINHMQG